MPIGHAPHPPLRLGDAPLRLVQPLASGGMGTVWSAERAHDSQPTVAVKLMRADRVADESAQRSFARETQIGLGLRHRNIVGYLGSGSLPDGEWPEPLAAGCPWLAMDLASGGTLDARAGRMAWSDLRSALLELLDALAYLHGRELLHLDLKPSNALIGANGEVLLADFGLARGVGPRGVDGPLDWGTAAYMAPEQLSEDLQRIGPRTDLYGLGCVAWTLLSGRPPFGRAPEEAAVQHLYNPVPNLVSAQPAPLEVELWLRRLLAKDPANRFEDAHTAAVALLALGEPVAEPGAGFTIRRSTAVEPTTRPVPGAGRPRVASDPRKRAGP